jgi:hypothetical protein
VIGLRLAIKRRKEVAEKEGIPEKQLRLRLSG